MTQPSCDIILTSWDRTYLVSEKTHPKNHIIVTSHRSEDSYEPSNNVNKMPSVGVVETYLYENVTETSC